MNFNKDSELNLDLLNNAYENKSKKYVKYFTLFDIYFATCEQVANSLNISLKKPNIKDLTESDPFQYLKKIAEINHFRIRQISLKPNWWKMDLGSLIVFYQNKICGLLAKTGGGYELVDLHENQTLNVNEKIAADIKKNAFIFYPTLPNTKLSLSDIYRFTISTFRKDFYKIILLQIMMLMFSLLVPVATGIIFERAIPSGDVSLVVQFAVILAINIFVIGLISLSQAIMLLRVRIKAGHKLQVGIWDRLLRLPLAFFKQYTAGDLIYRANSITEIQQIVSMSVALTVINGLLSIFNLAFMFYLDIYLSLGVLVFTVILALVNFGLGMIILKYERQLINQNSKISSLVLELVNSLLKLRIANREQSGLQLWMQQYATKTEAQLRAGKFKVILNVFKAGFLGASILAIYSLVILRGSSLSFGVFIIFNAIFMQFFSSIMIMTSVISESLTIIPLFDRAKPIFENLPEETEAQNEPGEIDGHIIMNNVVFRYDRNTKPILRNFTLEILPGSFTAIVGLSGSGKSTIFRLLLGLEQPESGEIIYSGMNIKNLRIQSLRKQLGVVMQTTQLVSGTIYENIAIQCHDLSREQAWEIIELVGISDMIRDLPMGIDTLINDGIQTLSGGEIQKINLARIIAGKPKILLLDEATSAIDSKMQYSIQEYLRKTKITQIMITHRFSGIVNADNIYVIDQGTCVESGTYHQLISQNGLFYQLAKRQF